MNARKNYKSSSLFQYVITLALNIPELQDEEGEMMSKTSKCFLSFVFLASLEVVRYTNIQDSEGQFPVKRLTD